MEWYVQIYWRRYVCHICNKLHLVTCDKSDFDNDTKDATETMGILDENQEVGLFMI